MPHCAAILGPSFNPMELKVITRRTLLIGASSFAMIAALGGLEALIEAQPALAQDVPPMALLVPPPLPQEVPSCLA
mgnify:CR=1 FL=1